MSDVLQVGDVSISVQRSPKPPAPNDCYIIGYELLTLNGAQRTLFKYPATYTEYRRALKSVKSAGGGNRKMAANLYYRLKPVEELCGFLLSDPLANDAPDPAYPFRRLTEWAMMYDGKVCGSLYHDPQSYPNTPWRAHLIKGAPKDTQPALSRREALLQAATLMGRRIL